MGEHPVVGGWLRGWGDIQVREVCVRILTLSLLCF